MQAFDWTSKGDFRRLVREYEKESFPEEPSSEEVVEMFLLAEERAL